MKKFSLKWIVALCLAAFVSVSAFAWEEKLVPLDRFAPVADQYLSYVVCSSPDDLLDYYKKEYGSDLPASDVFPGLKADDLPKGKFCIWTGYMTDKKVYFDSVPNSIISLIPDWYSEKDNYPIVGIDLSIDECTRRGATFYFLNRVLLIGSFSISNENVSISSNAKLFFLNSKIGDSLDMAANFNDSTKKAFRNAGYKGEFY